MRTLFESGRIVDLILLLVLLEAMLLMAYRRLTGMGIPWASVVPNLAAGACLMLALRFALTDRPWTSIALVLVLALLAHAADLVVRMR